MAGGLSRGLGVQDVQAAVQHRQLRDGAGGNLRGGFIAIVKLAQGRQIPEALDEFVLLGEGFGGGRNF